jgi:thiamine biosynthesis lipoprotein
VLDPTSRTVRFTAPGVELDPGGIGKGYAVDRVVRVLRESGITSALVDAGASTIRALGAPPGKEGWPVQIPRPKNRQQSVSTVFLRDNSLSTSGNYEKFFKLNGRLYCHIMDPRTGEPVQNMLQTTVIAPQAVDSDALSTAMFVMGPGTGTELLRSVPQAEVLWITDDSSTTHMITWNWPSEIPGAITAGDYLASQSRVMRKSKQGGSSHP